MCINKKLNKKGFTVIELVVVIAVIAILAAVIIPMFVNITKDAKLSSDQQAVRAMNEQLAIAEALRVSDAEVKAVKNSLVKDAFAETTGNRTVYDAQKDIENGGLNYNYTPLSANCSVYWIKEYNRVVLYDATESKSIYPEEYEGLEKNGNDTTWNSLKAADIKVDSNGVITSLGNLSGDVVIPDGVTTIKFAENVMAHNKEITSIVMPDSVTKLDSSVLNGIFRYCSNLESVTLSANLTVIGDSTFLGCTNLKNITIGSKVTSIGNQAFAGCTSLREINIPDSVTSIDTAAFTESGLESITIPDSVTSIGDRAFLGCENLSSVTLGSGITKLEQGIFSGCTSLKSFEIPSSVTTIANKAFLGSGLESIVIPATVTTIGEGNSRFAIGWGIFDGCTSLKTVEIYGYSDCDTNNNIYLRGCMFNGCTSLENVVIGAKLTHIEKGVLSSCTNLKSVKFESGNWKISGLTNGAGEVIIINADDTDGTKAATYIKNNAGKMILLMRS